MVVNIYINIFVFNIKLYIESGDTLYYIRQC